MTNTNNTEDDFYMKRAENNKCPRCGGDVPDVEHKGQYPGALSRWDGNGPIEVCSQCGQDEGLIQFMARLADGDPQFAVRPEARPWVKMPA